MRKNILIWIGFIVWCKLNIPSAYAQMERTVYQIFAVDSVETVILELVNFVYPEVHSWAGTSILTEVHVQVWDASPERVDALIRQGRYAFESERQGNTLRIRTKVRRREPIAMFREGKKKVCLEQTIVKVFVPDFYEFNPAEWQPDQVEKPKTLRRKTP
ncbi:MAG: hypothetical protein NZM43_05060 [Saprospiraceae bacterium]|nr:hypothetical protein [Saprospiraceae bacterium]MDW8483678.1 hypothetical protein [Saprospiraceae bacterium]